MKARSRRGPRSADLSRMVLARAGSRLAIARANDAFADAVLAAFRAEIASAVRSVSPMLLALLEQGDMRIEDAVAAIRPVPGWPDEPPVPVVGANNGVSGGPIGSPDMDVAIGVRVDGSTIAGWHGVTFGSPRDDLLGVYVADHSLEVAARIGGDWFVSLFGVVHVEMLPRPEEAFLSVEAGDPLDDFLSMPAIKGRGWIVGEVAVDGMGNGARFSFRTGSKRYRLPWA